MSSGGVMLSGWLRKSPPENKLRSRHHSWKKRWFVLKSGRLSGDPNVLEYSKYQTSKKPIKTINLNDCRQIDVNVSIPIKFDKKETSEHFVFSIVGSARTFYLITDSIREMSTWVQCLCDLCGFNHDSNDKGDLGRQKQTFQAPQPTNVNVNGTTEVSASLLSNAASHVPVLARPEKTLAEASRPINKPPISLQNGTINSSFTHPSKDPYEVSQSKSDATFGFHSSRHEPDSFPERMEAALMRPYLPVLREDADTSGYLHLADCDTGQCDNDSAFLSVDKDDNRRSSTDSVFAHDDGTNDSKDNESPILRTDIQPQSRFLQDTACGRLDSMPSVPPPPPPTVTTYFDDEDAVDARRKLTSPGGRGRQPSKLPPIDDSDLYHVPPGLQTDPTLINCMLHRQGSNSNSSHGSAYGSEGRYSAKTSTLLDYINTSENKESGSFSGAGPLSGSPILSTGHPSVSPANLGNQIYDVPSPLSPVFLMSASLRPSYQVPQSLERTVMPRNATAPAPELNKNETVTKIQLKGVQMLDVSTLSTPETESTYASAQDVGIERPSDLDASTDNTYAVPPVRLPKPAGPESLYSSPRAHSPSTSGMVEEHSIYDTVRHPSPLSPPHTTVIGTIPPDLLGNKYEMPSFGNRNALSATNSPMATPVMSRRIDINKTPSFNGKISPLVQESKGVSGSTPSLYDVPQPLSKSKSSQSSSASGDGNTSGRGLAADASNIYDLPRKLSDAASPHATATRHTEGIPKVDDLSHPSYEKMAARSNFVQDDANSYTAMAGVMSTPKMSFMSQVPPVHCLHSRLLDELSPQDVPPPVHRDLKPGRKSLGSDGGSSQCGMDRRFKNSRDSYESDEAVSPPHTSVTHTIPVITEPKHLPYGSIISPVGSRNGSITSLQHVKSSGGDDYSSRMGSSPTPPQRPPKSSLSSVSRRSPPLATSPNQLPVRPYTPTQGSQKRPQTRHDITNSAASFPPAPERPPKSANMRFTHMSMIGREDSRMPPKRPPKSGDDVSFVPSRPPKTSMTPSTGDSLHSVNSLHSMFFSHGVSPYDQSSVVPPAPPMDDIEKEIKYIEISTAQSNSQTHPVETIQDRGGPVEYIELDAGRTRALGIMKKERQNKLQQRANSDVHSMGKVKD